jgi:hypothetical protein
MAIEYLLVTYPEQRAVLADGNGVGFTNHTFMLPTDEYLITLDGAGYQPPSQDIALSGTSLVRPMVIAFTPASPVAAAPSSAVARPTPPTATDARRASRPARTKTKRA